MKIDIVTIFPGLFDNFLRTGILGKCVSDGRISINVHDLRDYSDYKHRQVDDYPYGGGRGMILMVEPLYNAYKALKKKKSITMLMRADGKLLTSASAKRFSRMDHIIIFCGRYEGVDERICDFIDHEISIGRYVLFGGEVPSMVFIETITRFIPTVLDEEVVANETYSLSKKSDHPQFTRPAVFKGKNVPEVLLSGDHAKIEKWREERRKKV